MTAPAPAQEEKDHPDVVIFPPVLLLATIALGIILDQFVPLGFLTKLPGIPRLVAGAALLVGGFSVVASVRRVFNASGTSIRPDQPTTALVTTGLFAHARNPVYLGGTIALIGVALLLASDWILLLTVPPHPSLRRGVARGALSRAQFGEPYRAYKVRVPRYGWKF